VTEISRDLEQLHRYHDGELAGLERWRFERRLRGSESLQSELAEMRSLTEEIGHSGFDGDATNSPDLWASIASALPAIDAQVDDERARGSIRASEAVEEKRGGFFGLPLPLPSSIPNWAVGSAALAAAATIAVMLVLPATTPPSLGGEAVTRRGAAPVVLASPVGAVRYLDSGGRSVMVIEDPAESMTIVWMMDSV
jgi:anti-sigma factor RsiW